MRLTPDQVRIITRNIQQHFGDRARVWLFGSRVDDRKKGGDVDLYVETDHVGLLPELRCKLGLEEALDLHVNLIVGTPGRDNPIHHIAKAEGVPL